MLDFGSSFYSTLCKALFFSFDYIKLWNADLANGVMSNSWEVVM